jgi:hypothetical protein
MAGGSGIHIKPANRGKYTARAKAHGRSVQEQARADLAPGSKASAAVRKQANFARNAKGFKHGRRSSDR